MLERAEKAAIFAWQIDSSQLADAEFARGLIEIRRAIAQRDLDRAHIARMRENIRDA